MRDMSVNAFISKVMGILVSLNTRVTYDNRIHLHGFKETAILNKILFEFSYGEGGSSMR